VEWEGLRKSCLSPAHTKAGEGDAEEREGTAASGDARILVPPRSRFASCKSPKGAMGIPRTLLRNKRLSSIPLGSALTLSYLRIVRDVAITKAQGYMRGRHFYRHRKSRC